MVKSYKDASGLYEVERSQTHAARDGFRINEFTISTSQKVPWHYHTHIADTLYVVEGEIIIYLREPKEKRRLCKGDCYAIEPKRAHLVANSGSGSATFMALQGIGEYNYVPVI